MFILDWIWGLIPTWAQWSLIGCALLFAAGVAWRFKDVLAAIKKIAGWPGVAGAVGAVGVLAAVFRPKAGKKPPTVLQNGRKPILPGLGRSAKRDPSKKRYLDENGYWRDAE